MAQTLGGASLEDGLFQSEDNQGHSSNARRGLRQVDYCEKNPGHVDFIPLRDFSIDHLPHLYRDKDVFQLVKATSDLTFLLRRSAASSETNTESEFTARRTGGTGTGWVSHVDERSCEIYMMTAGHVVHNDAEAKLTKCSFFFDSNNLNISERPSLTGLKVVERDKDGDRCEMMCATHDSDLLNKLYGMHRRWSVLNRKVHDKYNKYMISTIQPVQGAEGGSSDKDKVCIIVSHPHGHSKHITVGTWTGRYPAEVDDRYVENCVYTYSTPTCPGSSGAPVITLPKDGVRVLCWSNYSVHSGASRDVPGVSGGNREAMLLPRDERH